jgi:meckelin
MEYSLYCNAVPTLLYSLKTPSNYVLVYFLTSFILVLCGIGHIIFVKIFQFIIPQKKASFVDLCTISNISVFILDSHLHGYYIHGQAPGGKSDINLDELLKFIDDEQLGKSKGRGMCL